MKNIRKIEDFTENYGFHDNKVKIPNSHTVNEVLGEGQNLDNKTLSEPDVSDWLWDFGLQIKDFPKGGSNEAFSDLLDAEENLSIFTAQMINTFVVSSWYMATSKSAINDMFSEEDIQKLRSKLRGHFGIKKKLDRYKIERDEVMDFTQKFLTFANSGEFGVSVQKDASNIILRREIVEDTGLLKSSWTSLKSFFSKASYRRAIYWLIANLAANKSYVKWITQLSWPSRAIYTTNYLSKGITPEVKTAFQDFTVTTSFNADIPNMKYAESAINYAAYRAIEWSLQKRKDLEDSDTWMGALLNTDLFGLFQRILIISTCNWVYGLVGDRDVLSSLKGKPKDTSSVSSFDKSAHAITDLDLQIHKGIEIYSIPYLSEEFKNLLDVLLSTDEIGKKRYDRIISQIEKKEDARAVVSIVSRDIKNWAQKNIDNIENFKDMKALGTDYSTRIRVPVKLYDIMMQYK